jgi:hypothetical protein
LYLLDKKPTHAPAAGAPGDDEHGNLDHCVAVGEVRFDPNARSPHDAFFALRH